MKLPDEVTQYWENANGAMRHEPPKEHHVRLVREKFERLQISKDPHRRWMAWGAGKLERDYARDHGHELVEINIHNQHRAEEWVSDRQVDTVTSVTVFQHFPDRDWSRLVLQQMRSCTRPGGEGMVQIRYCETSQLERYEQRAKLPYAKHPADHCAWTIAEFWDQLDASGFRPTSVLLQPPERYAWFYFNA